MTRRLEAETIDRLVAQYVDGTTAAEGWRHDAPALAAETDARQHTSPAAKADRQDQSSENFSRLPRPAPDVLATISGGFQRIHRCFAIRVDYVEDHAGSQTDVGS